MALSFDDFVKGGTYASVFLRQQISFLFLASRKGPFRHNSNGHVPHAPLGFITGYSRFRCDRDRQ